MWTSLSSVDNFSSGLSVFPKLDVSQGSVDFLTSFMKIGGRVGGGNLVWISCESLD